MRHFLLEYLFLNPPDFYLVNLYLLFIDMYFVTFYLDCGLITDNNNKVQILILRTQSGSESSDVFFLLHISHIGN